MVFRSFIPTLNGRSLPQYVCNASVMAFALSRELTVITIAHFRRSILIKTGIIVVEVDIAHDLLL